MKKKPKTRFRGSHFFPVMAARQWYVTWKGNQRDQSMGIEELKGSIDEPYFLPLIITTIIIISISIFIMATIGKSKNDGAITRERYLLILTCSALLRMYSFRIYELHWKYRFQSLTTMNMRLRRKSFRRQQCKLHVTFLPLNVKLNSTALLNTQI